jgi:phosphoribosylformimino-5-aminoimidazole carboxamide ribotide isomerase
LDVFVLPVIDLKQGSAVAGIAGDRDSYQPLQSVLAADALPETVAAAYAQRLRLQQVYLADLDAIGGEEPAWDVYRRVGQNGVRLWIDAGIANRHQAAVMFSRAGSDLPVELIVGLESLTSHESLQGILNHAGSQRVVVSLDLMRGRTWTRVGAWQNCPPSQVAGDLLRMGVRRLILLDVSRVGTGTGTGTVKLLRDIRSKDAHVQLICGGGVNSLKQIDELAGEGCDGVLLASALHSGRLGAEELCRVQRL